MRKNKITLAVASIKRKLQFICGLLLIPFSLIGLCFYLPDPNHYGVGLIVFMIVLLLIGLLLLFCSFRTKKLISQFLLYVNILSNQSSMSIYDLSQTVGIPEMKVKQELQTMIDRRYFANAYIDHSKKCLVFPLMEQADKQEHNALDDELYVAVVCPICGGSNRVVSGKNNRCMYCGNIIRK